MEVSKEQASGYTLTIRILLCVLIIAAGLLIMKMLENLKTPPAEAKNLEKPLRVMARRMIPQDLSITIKGYGELQTRDEISISPEVAGRVTYIHPRLETGEVIQASEILFQIDDRNYMASVKELKALVAQGKNSIQRLKTQYAIDQKRLKTSKRNMDLSKSEFLRVKRLFEKSKVGTQSQVDATEKQYNTATDQYHLLLQTVELYPIRIDEATNAIAANQARLDVAQTNLERCQVNAPFDGRVAFVQIDKGQYVKVGQHLLTLANDQELEIHVPIDSQDVQKWLIFKQSTEKKLAWFADLQPVTCRIHWTEAPPEQYFEGTLHRVVKFDRQTRTITLAIHVDANKALSQNNALPLVAGMFCMVEIPGKTLKQVYQLPRWAVTYENTVYAAKDNRLKTVPVIVEKLEPETAIISKGITPHDVVIVTRLTDPIENALLDIAFDND
jgi:RND family efflux transporter MFP subunit